MLCQEMKLLYGQVVVAGAKSVFHKDNTYSASCPVIRPHPSLRDARRHRSTGFSYVLAVLFYNISTA